jgi:di/tricarboxylate transporter
MAWHPKDHGPRRPGDYWKPGLPLAALFAAVAVLLVPVIWPF